MSDPVKGQAARKLLRRLPLLAVLVLLASLWLGDRPREISLVWDLPDDPAPVRVEIELRAPDGTVPAAISWGDGTHPAADRQPQRALLAPGSHRFNATLTLPDGSTTRVSRELEIGEDDSQIVIHL